MEPKNKTSSISVNFGIRVLLIVCALFNTACASQTEMRESTSVGISPVNCQVLTNSKVITPDNPVSCDRLRQVSFKHLGEGNKTHDGSLIVLDAIAHKVSDLMRDLHDRRFVISKAIPISAYNGDDDASMSDNNSSAFNGRKIAGDTRWSMHSYGAAIDINPVQNPFIELNENGTAIIKPAASAHYSVNRLDNRPHKEAREGLAEKVVDVFAQHGFFVWGGDWNYPIDYQHFQIGPRSFIKQLTKVSASEAELQIQSFIDMYAECSSRRSRNVSNVRKLCIEQVVSSMNQY